MSSRVLLRARESKTPASHLTPPLSQAGERFLEADQGSVSKHAEKKNVNCQECQPIHKPNSARIIGVLIISWVRVSRKLTVSNNNKHTHVRLSPVGLRQRVPKTESDSMIHAFPNYVQHVPSRTSSGCG